MMTVPEDPRSQSGSSPTRSSGPFEVTIAGAGVAGIEAAIALTKRAPGRIRLTLVAPDDRLRFRPGLVLEPFGSSNVDGYSVELIARALGAELLCDRLSWVDRSGQMVHTEGGRSLHFDALALCLGAEPRPCCEDAIAIGDRAGDRLRNLLYDIRDGRVKRVVFLAAGPTVWPLPLYELALMTAARAADDSPDVEITLITTERAPLEIFGEEASRRVSELLSDRGIEVVCSADPATAPPGADRVVVLPELFGPNVPGLPRAAHGFIPIDRHCRVRGTERVFAAGDATDFAVKHGGIAAQQADVVADSIAALAGAPVRASEFRPTIHGLLLTGGEPCYLSARLTGGHAFGSELRAEATWAPPSKVAAGHLGPFLEQLGYQA